MKKIAVFFLAVFLYACSGNSKKGVEVQHYENGEVKSRIEYKGQKLDGYITGYCLSVF